MKALKNMFAKLSFKVQEVLRSDNLARERAGYEYARREYANGRMTIDDIEAEANGHGHEDTGPFERGMHRAIGELHELEEGVFVDRVK